MELSHAFKANFFESFPGFLSIRDENHRFTYLNDNFLNWIKAFTDVEPVGSTGPELANVVPKNVSNMLLACHDESLRFLASGECVPKVIRFEGHEGEQFFEVIKFKQNVDGKEYIFTTSFEVTKLHESVRLYQEKSLTCDLTGLKNKRALLERLQKSPESSGLVVAIDLDKFKWVNDECGHVAGDEVLKAFAGLLVDAFCEDDFIARVGGDEFLIICDERRSLNDTNNRLLDINAKFSTLFHNKYPYFDWSWGNIEFNGSSHEAIKEADMQMYQQKKKKRMACSR